MKDKIEGWKDAINTRRNSASQSDSAKGWFALPVLIILLLCLIFGYYWSDEPAPFDVVAAAAERAPETRASITTGSYTTSSVTTCY